MQKQKLNLDIYRRFGVELEVNSFDLKSKCSDGLPDGIYYISSLVRKATKDKVVIHKWGNDHYNESWILKPDGSCGMEICTPVLKGWQGLMQICRVSEALSKDNKIKSDERCSFHVHVDVSDLDEKTIAGIISWWIKCEPVFMDSVPKERKINQYCQFLGLSDKFDVHLHSPENLLKIVGECKYFSINAFHLFKKKRKTIEFRIMDSECCLNPWMAKNWVRLILHFVEMAIANGPPREYVKGDRFSGYCWLDPKDVFDILGFLPDQADLSPALEQVRRWFLGRLFNKGRNNDLFGSFSEEARMISIQQVDDLIEKIFGKEDFLSFTQEDVYSNKFRI